MRVLCSAFITSNIEHKKTLPVSKDIYLLLLLLMLLRLYVIVDDSTTVVVIKTAVGFGLLMSAVSIT